MIVFSVSKTSQVKNKIRAGTVKSALEKCTVSSVYLHKAGEPTSRVLLLNIPVHVDKLGDVFFPEPIYFQMLLF